MQNRRKKFIHALVIRPRPQFFLVAVIVGSFVCSQALSILIFTQWAKQNLSDIVFHSGDLTQIHEQIASSLSYFLLLSFLISGSAALIAAAFSLKFTHRVFGPLVPIVTVLNQLREGNYAARVRLRERDELGEVEESLNALAETLEKTKGRV